MAQSWHGSVTVVDSNGNILWAGSVVVPTQAKIAKSISAKRESKRLALMS
jgi:hypothetical protein